MHKVAITLEAMLLERKLSNFGHVIRSEDSVGKVLMLGIIEGSNREGGDNARDERKKQHGKKPWETKGDDTDVDLGKDDGFYYNITK